MTTNMRADFTVLESGRTVEDKITDVLSCLDFGASTGAGASANTTAINAAIAAATGGYVIVPPGISYTEASLVMNANVTLLVFSTDGRVVFLSSDTGDTPLSKSGIGIKQQNTTGVLLRAVDFGVTNEPFLQVVDLANGDIAATHTKFVEMDEITAPAVPSANKSRLYTRDDGSGKTQLVVQFPTGAPVVVATQT